MDDIDDLIALIRTVAAGVPPMAAVGELEATLDKWADAPGFDQFQEALVSYRPGGGEPGLYDEAGLEFEARQFLHELGDHQSCPHG